MFVQHASAQRCNRKKNQIIINIFNAYLYFFGKYKEPVAFASSEQETITVKPLLTNLAHQPLLSFAA